MVRFLWAGNSASRELSGLRKQAKHVREESIHLAELLLHGLRRRPQVFSCCEGRGGVILYAGGDVSTQSLCRGALVMHGGGDHGVRAAQLCRESL